MSSNNNKIRQRSSLRYWPTWFYIAILYLLTYLPEKIQFGLGKALGRLLARDRRLHHFVTTNLTRCFTDYSPEQIDRLTSRYFINQGIDMVESVRIWARNGFSWIRDKIEIEGIEYIQSARATGKPIILVGSHFGNVDMGAVLMAYACKQFDLFEITVTYREQKNPIFDRTMKRGRSRYFNKVLPATDIRSVVKELKNNEVVWFAPDMDVDKKNAVFVPFMGVQASTTTSVSRLAKMTGALVVPYANYREDDGFRYRLKIFPALQDFPSDDVAYDTTRINQFIEDRIREKPEAYLWMLRRFKTRPPGEQAFYQ